jgi:hypothetical protein
MRCGTENYRSCTIYLCTFRCVSHIKNMHSGLKKLNDHNMKMIFIGYETGSKSYQCCDPVSR